MLEGASCCARLLFKRLKDFLGRNPLCDAVRQPRPQQPRQTCFGCQPLEKFHNSLHGMSWWQTAQSDHVETSDLFSDVTWAPLQTSRVIAGGISRCQNGLCLNVRGLWRQSLEGQIYCDFKTDLEVYSNEGWWNRKKKNKKKKVFFFAHRCRSLNGSYLSTLHY